MGHLCWVEATLDTFVLLLLLPGGYHSIVESSEILRLPLALCAAILQWHPGVHQIVIFLSTIQMQTHASPSAQSTPHNMLWFSLLVCVSISVFLQSQHHKMQQSQLCTHTACCHSIIKCNKIIYASILLTACCHSIIKCNKIIFAPMLLTACCHSIIKCNISSMHP